MIIDGLVVRYPFLSAGVIGKSVMGKDIHSLWIGTGEKQVFYSASYHANESITTPVLLTFVEEYAAAYAAGGNIVFHRLSGRNIVDRRAWGRNPSMRGRYLMNTGSAWCRL